MKQLPKLSLYKQLLADYHRVLDLMSPSAVTHLDTKLEDSLQYAEALTPLISEEKVILDVGSGAGLPGIPIAAALPHCSVHLVERRSKRATFLRIVKSKLELDNITVHTADVTTLDDLNVSFVTALAVAPFADLYCLTRHLHASKVTLVSRKGEGWAGEIDCLIARLRAAADTTVPNEVSTLPLNNDGTLVSVRLTGGLACQL